MRYVLGLVILLLATSGLFAADKTKSKTSADQPDPLQLGILIGGKSWDLADTYPDKSRKNSQKAELHTPRNEAIIGFLLTDPNEYGIQYTCTYKDTLIGNEKTETVEAGKPCPNVPHNTQSLYIKALKVEFTGKATGAGGNIKISCRLYDVITGIMTLSDTDPPPPGALPTLPASRPPRPPVSYEPLLPPTHAAHPRHYVHAAHRRYGTRHRAHVAYGPPPVPFVLPVVFALPPPPAEPPAPTPCAAVIDTQRIVGVEISLQPPPSPSPSPPSSSSSSSSPPLSFQLGTLVDGNYQVPDWFDSSADAANDNTATATAKFLKPNKAISGFALKHQVQDKKQKIENPFSYSCAFKQDFADDATPPPGDATNATATEPDNCPDLAGANKPLYLTKFSVDDNPAGTIKFSCWLYDRKTQATIITTPGTVACTTGDTQKIVGVQIAVKPSPPPPPPPLQMSVYVQGNKDSQPAVYSTDNNVPAAKFQTTPDKPISGFSLKHQTSDKNQKPDYPFNYLCSYKEVVTAAGVIAPEVPATAKEGEPCPDPAGVAGPAYYLTELNIVDNPQGTTNLSCSLYDITTKATIEKVACKTTETQRIVGVTVSVQQPPPPLFQLSVLAAGKWTPPPSLSGVTDKGSQTFTAPAPPAPAVGIFTAPAPPAPIVGIFLRNETPDFSFLYTCVLHDTELNQDVPITVPAGVPCMGDTSDPKTLYVKALRVEPTSNPPPKFTISCTLFEKDKPDQSVNPCKTATNTQRIGSVQVKIQLPPLQP